MYAIVDIKGQQIKVEKGRWIKTPKLNINDNESIELDKVLAFNDGTNSLVGSPYLSDVKVKAKVLDTKKDKKIIVFKYKKRKDYRRKYGHRQEYSKVLIENIEKS